MELILWRHADAQPLVSARVEAGEGAAELAVHDAARRLTPRGQAQAQCVARWLNERLAADTVVWSSPAVRCVSTAAALGRSYLTDPALSVQASGLSVLAHLRAAARVEPWRASALLLVGHEPWLGELAAALLGTQVGAFEFKKGAVCWLAPQAQGGTLQASLRARVSPEDLGSC